MKSTDISVPEHFHKVLGPCMAFRSEEFGWKNQVRPASRAIENDRVAAHAAVLADDGFSLGVLFKDDQVILKPADPVSGEALAGLKRQFLVGGAADARLR